MEENKTLEISEETKLNKKRITRKRLVIIIAVIAAITTYVIYRGNYLEMKELGENYIDVFWRNTAYSLITFIINFAILFCAFYFTNKTIRKGIKIFFDEEKKEVPQFPNKSISFIIALIGSTVSTNILINKILLCFSNTQFGISDPVFNIDISFFVLQKPFIQYLLIYLLVVVIATLGYAVIYSIIILNKSFDGVSRDTITKCDLIRRVGSRVKLIAILAGLFIVSTMVTNIGNEKFMNVDLTDGSFFSLYGAGMADATVKLWGYVILAILATYSILRAYKSIKKKSLRGVVGNILIVPIYLIVLAGVLALYQLIFIGSNKLAADESYIENNIKFTKDAYGINADEETIDYSGTITAEDIEKNKSIINNIDIVTSYNVLQDLEDSKTSKGYYTYRQTQIQNYNISGADTLVYITPREMQNANSSNKSYQYTHGYGAIVTYAGDVDENGNLKTANKEFNNLENAKIKITEPRIYFGLQTNNIAIINSKKQEIDYIDENSKDEVTYNYQGSAGLKLNFIDRLILGIRERNMQIPFSGSNTSESKVITNRNVLERVKTAMPYLKYDSNAYMVIDDEGKEYWVIDAYTVSNYYPFSQKTTLNNLEEINYIRNSVKVIVNAYDGTMKFYITDRQDPIAMAYNNVYPTLFAKENESIPKDIQKHFVYPQMLFNIQSDIIEEYHSIKPEVLYRGNDIWEVANSTVSGKEEKVSAYYGMYKDDNEKGTLGLIIPYSDYDKESIRAYMIGTIKDGKNKLKICRFSADSNVLGLSQLEAQISQDEEIAADITSLNTTGTRTTKKMTAIPINNTILYVETIYQQLINESTQKPMLKRVVLASGNRVAIGENTDQALSNLLATDEANIDVSNREDVSDLVNAIVKANDNVKNSSKSNDWKLFGEDMQKLNDLIDQLKTVVEKQKKEAEEESKQLETNNIVIENSITE